MEGRKLSTRRQTQRGSSVVEFSLTLLPMLAMLFLTLDLAWILFAWACVQEGVREGVRTAITGKPDAAIIATVQTYSFGIAKNAGSVTPIVVSYYSASNPTQTTSGSGTTCSGNIVKVTVTGINIFPMAPVWRNNTPITLSGSGADIVESNSTCR